MKYLAKTFVKTGSKFGESPDWTKGQLVFNAVARKYKYRLWGSSRHLTMEMKRSSDELEEYEIQWYKTELCGGINDPCEVWRAKPDVIDEVNESFEEYKESIKNLKL